MRAGGVGRVVGAVSLAVLALGVATSAGRPAAAEGTDPSTVSVRAELDGRSLVSASTRRPVRLVPRPPVPVQLVLHNEGVTSRTVRYVRLEARTLGLTAVAYDLGVRVELGPDERTVVRTELDAFDLERQVTGYLPAAIRVYDEDRRLLGEQAFALDLRGEPTALLALLAALVLLLAVAGTALVVLAGRRRRLSTSRLVRAGQGGLCGAAFGVAFAFGVPVLRIAFVERWGWVVAILAAGGVGLASLLPAGEPVPTAPPPQMAAH